MISQNHRLDQQLIEREDHYMATAARINYYDLVIDHAHGPCLPMLMATNTSIC
ncbi:hypothetical protein TUA1478L_30970 [Lactiplantibacillus plantarum]